MRAFKASVMSCGISDISEEARRSSVFLRCTGKQYISLQDVWHLSRLCLTLVLLRSPGALGIRKTGGVFRVCLVALLLGVFVQMSMATKRGVMDNCPARG